MFCCGKDNLITFQLNVFGPILAVGLSMMRPHVNKDLMTVCQEIAVSIFLTHRWFLHLILHFSISVDYKICKDVDNNPHAYLVPHPEDCTKFYSCQNLGWKGGYIAHLMDCPPTTGFDTKLRICNYIRALPRCNKGT